MGFMNNTESISRRVMTLFFMVDTSGSMEGAKIGSVNSAIQELIPELKEMSESNADAEIKMAVLTFSSGCEWITPTPVSLESFGDWEPIDADGLTDLGEACLELSSKLSTSTGFMTKQVGPIGFYAPVIILLSDGGPTDDYENGLKELKKNNWYKSALKIAIAIGKDAKTDLLKKFTENPELVIPVNNKSMLKKLIRFVAVTSSQIASTSSSVSSAQASDDAVPVKVDVKDFSSSSAEKQITDAIQNMQKEEKQEAIMMEDDDGFSDSDEF